MISVAVPFPTLDLLTYRVPDAFDSPLPGTRVLVPLGSRLVTGCVVGEASVRDRARGAALKDILDILDTDPFLPADVLTLALWVAEYYASGPGAAVAAAMPPNAWLAGDPVVEITERGRVALGDRTCDGRGRLLLERLSGASRPLAFDELARALGDGVRTGRLHGSHRHPRGSRRKDVRARVRRLAKDGLVRITQAIKGRAQAFKHLRTAALTDAGLAWLEDPAPRQGEAAGHPLGARQREALTRLGDSPDGLDLAELVANDISQDTIARLVARGLVTVGRRRVARAPASAMWPDEDTDAQSPLDLTAEQAVALEHLAPLVANRAFRTVLLHGVTGSGKTEIYLRLAEQVVDAGRSVLVLVPEIALTPAATRSFQRRFGDRVAVLHSGLSDGERYDQWHRIRRGEAPIAIGTRSAVFAPLQSLGLIVVDEEHDTSFKQEESPRYHARDVAVMRGKQTQALVVLGSATPSLETFQNAARGRYECVTLTRRVLDRPLASVHLIDMREEYAASGPDVVLSRALKQALTDCLVRGEQALVLLNRRGYAPALFCRQCTSALECPNCSVSLTIHRANARARCHYCNYATPIPRTCRSCGGGFLELSGFGTERVHNEITALLPSARISRLDRDTARVRGAGTELLARFARGEVDVLVGTQMIAKGHDFPRVTLVGVISADVGLGLADFRAAERTFQLLTQVAGRAGRSDQTGVAIVQTLYPGHYSVRCAREQNYSAFFEAELQYRTAMQYPPTVALVNAIVRAPTLAGAMRDATHLVRRLRGGRGFRVVGPAPAPFVRLRGEFRAQFFLKGTNRGLMRDRVAEAISAETGLGRRVTVDVDPLSVL